MKFKIIYERSTNAGKYYWTYAEEIIEARGIMHASKIAHDHLKTLKKKEPQAYKLRVSKILQK